MLNLINCATVNSLSYKRFLSSFHPTFCPGNPKTIAQIIATLDIPELMFTLFVSAEIVGIGTMRNKRVGPPQIPN